MIGQLWAGCDSLYWSAKADIEEVVIRLQAERDRVAGGGGATPVDVPQGFALRVQPFGTRHYPVLLKCFEFWLQLNKSRHLPNVYVQLRSAYLHEVGPERAFAESVATAEAIVGRALAEPHVSRIDLYADYTPWQLRHEDHRGFVSHAKRRTVASDAVEVETFQFGETPLLVRAYRKDVERRQKGEQPLPTWHGEQGPIVRVEVQANAEFLRKLGVRTFADATVSGGDIWRYATHRFVRLHEVGSGDRERWPLRPEWQVVQRTRFDSFASAGVLPYVELQGDRLRILRALRGYLVSLGALEDLRDPPAVLSRLGTLLPVVARGRSFAADVEARRALLPRAVLRGGRDAQL